MSILYDLISPPPQRYRPQRRFHLPILVAVLALHVGLGLALYRFGVTDMLAPMPSAPLVVELIAIKPPPPSRATTETEALSPTTPIVSPLPIVQTPRVAPEITTTSVASPLPPRLTANSTAAVADSGTPTPQTPIVPPNAYAEGLDNPVPRYPLESRRLREQGTVVLAVEVTIDGRVASVHVANSSGHPRLDRSALDTVKSWRFQPAMQAGHAVAARGIVEIPFILIR